MKKILSIAIISLALFSCESTDFDNLRRNNPTTEVHNNSESMVELTDTKGRAVGKQDGREHYYYRATIWYDFKNKTSKPIRVTLEREGVYITVEKNKLHDNWENYVTIHNEENLSIVLEPYSEGYITESIKGIPSGEWYTYKPKKIIINAEWLE